MKIIKITHNTQDKEVFRVMRREQAREFFKTTSIVSKMLLALINPVKLLRVSMMI
jgi:hypothetical protein